MRVVALEHAVAAPLCSRHLADLGAEVIKVERPGEGDFARAYDNYVQRQSQLLHLAQSRQAQRHAGREDPEARPRCWTRLIAGADVLLQNLAPGAAARLGLSHADLTPRHPEADRVRHLRLRRERPVRAEEGLRPADPGRIRADQRHRIAGEPSRVGISIADIATGMYALTGILAALVRRGRTGRGSQRENRDARRARRMDDISDVLRQAYARIRRRRACRPAIRRIAPYGAHQTKDGQVIFGLQNEREWATFCAKVLGEPEVADRSALRATTAHGANIGTI